jgi:hypothetical protein
MDRIRIRVSRGNGSSFGIYSEIFGWHVSTSAINMPWRVQYCVITLTGSDASLPFPRLAMVVSITWITRAVSHGATYPAAGAQLACAVSFWSVLVVIVDME